MVHCPSKRILLIDADPAVDHELRTILQVRDAAADAGPPGGQDPGTPLTQVEALPMAPTLRGLELEWASDGEEGWRRVREAVQIGRPYLLAIADLHPAGPWDAEEMVRRLWTVDPELPVLLLTQGPDAAEQRRQIVRRLKRIDRFLFLSKPLEPDEIRQMVASQADRRLAHGQLQEVAEELNRALQRAREEAEAASRAKSEFMANISHEIRTPMNAILGFTRLLMKEPLSAHQLEKLQYVRDAGESLLSLINNVLDYSKLVAGQLNLSTAAFHLDALLGDVIETTRPAACKKGLVLRHHVVEAVPRLLRGDKTRLRQILVNLVSNAIKFTEHGTIHIQTSLDEQNDDTATLRIVVTDTGVGIPAERHAVIFESFSQADGSSTRQFEGVGLGLSICKRLIDLMGGQIGFRSDPHSGSAFWLTLTLEKHRRDDAGLAVDLPLSVAAAGEASAGDDLGGDARGKPHVLVAEADHLNRTLEEMLLVRAGCLVDLACNGQEALRMLDQSQYELVLMDIEMPRIDGLKVIEAIRKREAASGGHLPIVVLTAHPIPSDRDRFLATGADQYLAKPLSPETLIGTLQRYLPQCLDEPEQDGGEPCPQPPAESAEAGQDHLRMLQQALDKNGLAELEVSAGVMRRWALEQGFQAVADHAMRVQLAARAGDRQKAQTAQERLRSAIEDSPIAVGVPDHSPHTGSCRETPEDAIPNR